MQPLGRKHTVASDIDQPYGEAGEEGRPVVVNVKVKELEVEDRPREKAMAHGIGALSTADLFAVILRTGQQGYPITQLCRELMKANDNSLFNLERRTRDELLEIDGIGPAKALQIEAVMELIRRYNREKVKEKVTVTTPEVIYELMRPEIGNLPHEEIWAIFLDNSNKVIDKRRITQGGPKASVFDMKKVMKHAIIIGSEGIVLAHNHPSGAKIPSPQDNDLTRRLREACRTMELRLLDHVIVTSDGFYSYATSSSILG